MASDLPVALAPLRIYSALGVCYGTTPAGPQRRTILVDVAVEPKAVDLSVLVRRN